MALQKTAQKAVKEFSETLPSDILLLEEFPGIGPYTARAVTIFSYNTPIACIETNIRRVYIHHFFNDKINITDAEILEIAQQALDKKDSRQWHYALMDYGAYLKTQIPNPNRKHKNYSVQPKFEGSLRQIRGAILKMLSAKPMSVKELIPRIRKLTNQSAERTQKVVLGLEKEGLIVGHGKKKEYSLS